MAILHKNITAAADIHNPKWFSGANNGDYAFKNEKGELESIDELLLPAALNFVDASVAPPTTNSGDIYILSSGGSVNAGWGSVSLQDWVRYDGTQWNSITPQKSSLCYDKTADSLMVYDGAAWAAIGGGGGGSSIYTADGTVSGDRVVNLNTNDLDFKDGNLSTTLTSYIGASNPQGKFFSIPSNREGFFDGSLWFRNLNNSTGATTAHHRFYSGGLPSYVAAGTATADKFSFGKTNNNSGAKFEMLAQYSGMFIHNNAPVTKSFLGLLHLYPDTGAGTVALNVENPVGTIMMARGNANREVIIRGSNVLGSEKISLQGHTVVQGAGTSTGTTLALFDNDTIPNKTFEVLDNGRVKLLSLPTSSAGLSSGDLYNDSGTIKIV